MKWGSHREVADRVVFMDAGQIIEADTPANFFANPQHARTKLFLARICGECRRHSSLLERHVDLALPFQPFRNRQVLRAHELRIEEL